MNKLLLTAYGFSTSKIINVAQKMIQENKITKACIISTSWPKEKEKHPQMQQIKRDLLSMNIQQVDFLDVEFEDANKLFDYDLFFFEWGLSILPFALHQKKWC